MNRLLNFFELPLLSRELRQLAERRRLYVMRVLYALALVVMGGTTLLGFLGRLDSRVLGFGMPGGMSAGSRLFMGLLYPQMLAVHLFMPAIGCACFTAEKERNTLGLLFLTRLGPWRIVFEKLFSRLVPLLSCLLLSMPLLAMAYTMGGLSPNLLINGPVLLFLTGLQIASLTMLCSVFFRTTTAAFVWSYLLQILIALGFAFLAPIPNHFSVWGQAGGTAWISGLQMSQLWGAESPALVLGVWSAGLYASIIVCIVLSRVFLYRRAFLAPGTRLMRLFHALDRFFVWLNDRVARGVVLVADAESLPDDRPVAWREVTKKSLGTARYLFRVFVALELPAAVLCLQFLIFDTQQRTLGVPLLTLLVWGVGAMFVTVRAATAIGSERSGQTLDVLLTTPLTGREILLQKMAGVRRLMIVVSMPILTAAAFTMYLRGTTTPEAIRYGVWQAAQALIYLPLIAWVGVWIGLRIRRPTRAVFSAVATIAVWATVPFVLNYFRGIAASLAGIEGNLWMFVLNLASSPAAGLATNERTAYLPGGYKVITLHAAFYAAILFFVRSRVLRGVDRRLGRAAPPEKPADHARLQAMADESPTLAEASHAI